MQDGSPEWVTVLACVCAEGSHLPPSLIFQSAAGAIPSRWVEGIKANEQSVHVTSSLPGWTNNDIGLACLEQVFDRHTKEKARQSYQLLTGCATAKPVCQGLFELFAKKQFKPEF
jgi:hypothetical protein